MTDISVPVQKLPGAGVAISKIGLGCVTFGREIDEDTAFQIMDYAVENGIRFFDTAESYSNGASEKIVGCWLRMRGMYGHISIETKISTKFNKEHIREAIDASLARLGVDRIDAYLLHFMDHAVPLEVTLEALTLAVENGKIQSAGCSNFNAGELNAALDLSERRGLARLTIIQPSYNLVSREIEGDVLPVAIERGVAVVSYSPLGAGFLTGKYAPGRAFPTGSRFDVKPAHANVYFKRDNFRLLDLLRQKSACTGLSMARLALGWVLGNPDLTSVLIGARSILHVTNALEALASPLPAELLAEMAGWSVIPTP